MSRNEVQEQQPTAALATYLLLVRSCFFVSRSPKDGAHKAELRAPGNTLHNCIFSSRPLSITLVVRHTRTQLLSLLPLYSSALAFPTTSFLPLASTEMLLHDLLACQSFLCLFLSPKSFYLKVRFLLLSWNSHRQIQLKQLRNELVTNWANRHKALPVLLFIMIKVIPRPFGGGFKSSLSLSSSAYMSHSCELT